MTFGVGDTVAIIVAIAFLLVGLINPFNRSFDRAITVLANGLSFGTLILIVLSPLTQLAHVQTNLLELAVKDGKLSLWWAPYWHASTLSAFCLNGRRLQLARLEHIGVLSPP